MANENCLAGMACPHCGSEGPFLIEATSCFKMTDHGTEEHRDVQWTPQSTVTCCACDTGGTVGTFTIEQAPLSSMVVQWEIDVEVSSLEGKYGIVPDDPTRLAAKYAWECMRRPDSIANYFTVVTPTGVVGIDLSEDDGSEESPALHSGAPKPRRVTEKLELTESFFDEFRHAVTQALCDVLEPYGLHSPSAAEDEGWTLSMIEEVHELLEKQVREIVASAAE